MQRYVIDSSVFNKLYLDEPDRDKAQRLFVKAAATEIMQKSPKFSKKGLFNSLYRVLPLKLTPVSLQTLKGLETAVSKTDFDQSHSDWLHRIRCSNWFLSLRVACRKWPSLHLSRVGSEAQR